MSSGSSSTPLQSLLGGFGVAFAAHELLVLNGSVLGISGFVHRSIKGNLEALAGVAGLVLGGFIISYLDGSAVPPFGVPLPQVLLAGFLVGLGTKLANGCTSGHMICGISRLSYRSIVATATFFTTGVMTANVFHGDSLPIVTWADSSLANHNVQTLVFQAASIATLSAFYFIGTHTATIDNVPAASEKQHEEPPPPPRIFLRILTYLITSFQFGLALRLSNMTEAQRILGFLLLPFHPRFDPSLLFVAVSAVPFSILLYHFGRGKSDRARLGGKWSIPPEGGKIDAKLVIGSAIFGIGWGLVGVCPGPGLVNLGGALGSDRRVLGPYAAWLAAMIGGGMLA